MVSEIVIDMPAGKETCSICTDDNISSDHMFSVDICHHRFCSECVKRHIEVRLLEGRTMTCPHDGCQSKLNYVTCVNLLTPKLKEIWRQKMIEDLIPVTKRVYCPDPRCSALMSETELSIKKSTDDEAGVRRFCVRCRKPFCINCKVPWHSNYLSCEDYKSLHPNPTASERKLKALANQKRWRQCGKCQNMVELSQGCVSVVCRCGHTFCYRCGAEKGGCRHGHNFYDLRTGRLLYRPWCACLWLIVLLLVLAAIVVVVVLFIIHYVRKS